MMLPSHGGLVILEGATVLNTDSAHINILLVAATEVMMCHFSPDGFLLFCELWLFDCIIGTDLCVDEDFCMLWIKIMGKDYG